MLNARSFPALSVLLVLALLFAAPLPADARPLEPLRLRATADPIRLLIDWLDGLWGDNGCTFDPNGGCRDTPETDGSDAGCTFDPGGTPCRDDR